MTALAFALILSALDPTVTTSPTTTPSRISECLLRICLGDSIASTFDRLQDGAPPVHTAGDVFSSFDSFAIDNVIVREQFQGGVVVSVGEQILKTGRTNTTDSYGVQLGLATKDLTKLRGIPDGQEGDVWRYGSVDGPHWLYKIRNDMVVEISVTSLAKMPD